MHRLLKHRFLVGALALLLAGSAGGAYAATQSGTNPRQALINDVAKRLNVSPAQLRSAIQGALLDRLQAAVNAGEITQARADRIKQRIERGELPLGLIEPGGSWRHRFGLRGFGPRGLALGGGPLSAAAGYLGVSEPQLLGDLRGGKTLAQVARAEGKSVTGLEQALVAADRARLERLVASGWITRSQAQRRLDALRARIGDLVNRTAPRFMVPPALPGPPPAPAPSPGTGPSLGPGPFGAPPPGA